MISQYRTTSKTNQSKVICCFDCDDYDSKQEDLKFLEDAEKIIAKCKESGLIENTYVAHCPHCGSAIKMDKNKEKLLTIKECYVCERKITLEKEDIFPVYALS